MLRRCVLVVAIAACGRLGFEPIGSRGDDATGDGGVTSGSRLRVESWTAADGAAQFANFFDTMLQVRCNFLLDTAGTTRCLPIDPLADAYVDSSCTIPAVHAAPGCGATPVLARLGTTAYAVGAPLATAYVHAPNCTLATDGAAYYELGAAQPDAMFVAATIATTPVDSALARTELVGEDGSRVETGAVATMTGTSCTFQATSATSGVCVPATAQTINTAMREYADAACTQEITSLVQTPPPPYLTFNSLESICRPLRIVATGAQSTPGKVYFRNAAGACASYQPLAGTVYTAVSDVAGLPTVQHVVDAGTTRLDGSAWVTSGGERFEDRWFDTMLGAPCTPTTDDTGHTSCVPFDPAPHVLPVYPTTACSGSSTTVTIVCTNDDTFAVVPPLQHPTVATCDGPGVPLARYPTTTTTAGPYYQAGAGCVPIGLIDGALRDAASVAYDPALLVALTRK